MLINRENLKALFAGYNTKFNEAFQSTEAHMEKIATVVPSTGAEESYAWLNSFPVMREWVGDRVINSPESFGYTIKNRDFESTFSVSRNDIDDDKYGVAAPLAARLGELSKLHPDELIFKLMADGHKTTCYDGQYFFDTDHPVKDGVTSNMIGNPADGHAPWFLLDTTKIVRPFIFQKRRDYKLISLTDDRDENVFMRNEYIYGVDARANAGYGVWQFAFACYAPLSEESYKQARWNMRAMKGPTGRPLHVTPNLLVVPPEHEDQARKLLFAETINVNSNVYKGSADLIVSSWLDAD